MNYIIMDIKITVTMSIVFPPKGSSCIVIFMYINTKAFLTFAPQIGNHFYPRDRY